MVITYNLDFHTCTTGTVVKCCKFAVKIVTIANSIPQSWLVDFVRIVGKHVKLTLEVKPQFSDIISELMDPINHEQNQDTAIRDKHSTTYCDLVSLGDQWLCHAIRHRLIQPIHKIGKNTWLDRVDVRLQEVTRRNPFTGILDPNGEVFGAPFRWGCTLIAVNHVQVFKTWARPILEWRDLLQPQLKGHVAFLNSSREFMGVVFKTLGLSYNTTITDLKLAPVTWEHAKIRAW